MVISATCEGGGGVHGFRSLRCPHFAKFRVWNFLSMCFSFSFGMCLLTLMLMIVMSCVLLCCCSLLTTIHSILSKFIIPHLLIINPYFSRAHDSPLISHPTTLENEILATFALLIHAVHIMLATLTIRCHSLRHFVFFGCGGVLVA